MIRLQDNVPQTYINNSRDFQLFCRLYDCINNGVKYDIDTIIYLFDPFKCNNKILDLLAARVGFYPKITLNDSMMRYIVSAFPYINKYKGSLTGIASAVATVLKAEHITANFTVSIVNKQAGSDGTGADDYYVKIILDKLCNETALTELLNYVLPIGYKLKFVVGDTYKYITDLDQVNFVRMRKDAIASVSQVTYSTDDLKLPEYDAYVTTKATNGSNLTTPGVPTKYIITNNDGSIDVIYTYYTESVKTGGGTFIEQHVTKAHMVDINDNRNIGTLGRVEVVGLTNDLDVINNANKNSTYGFDKLSISNQVSKVDSYTSDNILGSNFTDGDYIMQTVIAIDANTAVNLSTGTTIPKSYFKSTTQSNIKVGTFISDLHYNIAQITAVGTDYTYKLVFKGEFNNDI